MRRTVPVAPNEPIEPAGPLFHAGRGRRLWASHPAISPLQIPFSRVYYTHIHLNDKEAIGTRCRWLFAFDASKKPL